MGYNSGVRQHKKFEPHHQNSTGKLNKLRAAVLGANDGILSIAGIVVGVAGATSSRSAIFTAGVAGILAGAFSMAAGEYVSVSSQRDTERALLKLEKSEIEQFPEQELEELVGIYISKGLSPKTAEKVASELTKKDAYRAHLDAELAINPEDLVNPWQAALSSAVAFLVGSVLPLLTIILPPQSFRVTVTFFGTLIALAVNGALGAKFGGAPVGRAMFRVCAGGALAMAVTYSIGHLIGGVSL